MQRDRPRDAHARLLSARQLVRKAIEQVDGQADQSSQFLAAGAQRAAAPDIAELHDRVHDGARGGETGVEAVGRILKYHLDATAQRQPRKGVGQHGADLVAIERDAAGGLVQQPHHHHRGGGLAAAGFANQAHALAMTDGKTDAVDRSEILQLDRRLAREQLCQRRGGALARIFLDELFDKKKRSLLPLPACGERVGVRGFLRERNSWRVPLTRIALQSDLSPQAGRG